MTCLGWVCVSAVPSSGCSYLFVRQVWVCFGQCRSCVRLWEPVRLFVREVSGMCVGFLPLSCAVPVSGYSCLPFSDIGQEIVARARAEGRETWISRGF